MSQLRPPGEDHLVARVLHPEAGRRDHETLPLRDIAAVGDGEERDPVKVDALQARVRVEQQVDGEMPGLVREEGSRCPGQEAAR